MYRKNVAGQHLPFALISAADGSALTGATVTARRSLDGGAQANATGSVSELGNGQYNLALSQADTNGNQIGVLLTATGAIPVHFTLLTTAADPTDGVRLGLTALPSAAAGANGGLPTGNASGQVVVSGTAANAINAASLDPDVTTEIQSGLATAASITTLSAFVDTEVASILAAVDTEVAAILADTNELQTDWANGGRLDLILDARASQASVDAIDDFVDTEIAAIQTTLGTPAGASLAADIAAIEAQTDDIGAAGAGLTGVPWNPAWDAEVQSEVADALGVYDPPTHAELVSEVNAVQADIAALNNLSAAQVNAEVDTALADARLDELLAADSDIDGAAPPAVGSVFHELLSKTAGSFTFDQTTDSLEALADSGGGGPTAAQIADAVWDETLAGHLGAGSTGEALNAAGAAGDPWVTALPGAYGAGSAGFIVGTNLDQTVSSRASQASVDAVDDFLDTEVGAILADTNELQTDWANGGRLDNILDARASQASVDDIPTNAELTAALGGLNDLDATEVQAAAAAALTAYDPPTGAELVTEINSVQADIAALNNLSQAQAQTAAAAALTAYDPPTKAELDAGLAALNDVSTAEVQTAAAAALAAYDGPTNAELTAALAAADDAVLAAIAALNDLSAAEVTAAVPAAATIASTLIATALSELTAAEPPDTPSVGQALMLPYMVLAQGGTMDKDTGISTYRNGAGTVILKRTLSDDGSVLTEGKLQAGP